MSEIKRVVTPMANTMMVLEQGEEILRSPSSLSRRPLKKTASEGLISLSAEPGTVKFEMETQKLPVLGGQRCSSAGRIERKLQLFKKTQEMEVQRRNCTDGIFSNSHADNSLVNKINAMTMDATTSATKILKDEKNQKSESESSESESDSGKSDSTEEKGEIPASDDDKVTAPLEMKAEFIQCVMNGEYTKAKQVCQKILLLEPDNVTCNEFHSVITLKIEQDNREDSDEDGSDDSSDDSSEDDDSDNEDTNDSNTTTSSSGSSSSEDSEAESDDEFTVTPGLNLIMGGLPIKPQSK